MRSNIINGLINIARRIGRWIVQRLAKTAITKLIGYMEGKIEDFGRRLSKARTDNRKSWLRGRIKRWQAAVAWLTSHSSSIALCTAKQLSEIDSTIKAKGIPVVAECERLAA